ncbi:MAG TPA: hypothetical protein PLJ78_03510 [Anaerolineae bacterium]|nr:hypothetical protein [Anaerolineae bacterium]HQK12996.1 hypothetical protein [Anaerolineae bacterium]
MFDTLLAKAFTIFAQVMVKFQPIWDKYKLLISLALGVAIGLVLGWGVFPVQWENANPGKLREDFRSVYLASVAEDYARTNDIRAVREKLGMGLDLPKDRTIPWRANPEVLKKDLDAAVKYAEAGKFNLGDKVTVLKRLQQDLPMMISTWEAEEAAAKKAAGGVLNTLIRLLAALLIITLVAAALWFLFAGRKQKAAQPVPEPTVVTAPGGTVPGVAAPAIGVGEVEPSSVKTYTYVLGDDYFDPSFSIEIGPEFFGECGIGISETLGAGDPKKVTAFETWLFDKSDIRTVTTILASEYAFKDPGLFEKLQPKREGDVLDEINPGMEVVLETTALRVKARVLELEYAQGSNYPPNSYFQKVTFELRAWVKQPATDAAA